MPEKPKTETKEKLPEAKWESFAELDAVESYTDTMSAVLVSLDGRALGAQEGEIHRWNAKTGKESRKIYEGQEKIASLAVSPEGLIAAGQENGSVKILDFQGKAVQELPTPYGVITAECFSQDGLLLFGSSKGVISAFNLAEKRKVESLTASVSKNEISAIAISPKDKVILVGDTDGKLEVIDPKTTLETKHFDFTDGEVSALAIARDGMVVLGSSSGTIRILDLASGNVIKTLNGHSDRIISLTVSPEGKIISSSKDGTVRTWGAQ